VANQKEPAYQVERAPQVPEQIRALAAKAGSAGMKQELVETLKTIVHHLETEPRVWGDPEYRTRKTGGWVCHGILWPLHVHFVVYEAERVVFVLEIKALPGSQLE
jgi:hypothetical protein